jgi:hypothetical protein
MQSNIEYSSSSKAALNRSLLAFALVVASAACVTGCGNSLYALRANQASSKLEEARSAGAEQRAPYEYTLAKEHLEKAAAEAAEADYGDAYSLADSAYDYADQAAQKCSQNAPIPDAPSVKESDR